MNNSIGLYIVNHNNGKFLISAIYSVLRQTSKYDELIIYDNASNEEITNIVLKNAEKIGIKVIRLTTNNLVQTATKALLDIKCDYIFRLDGDDILKTQAIQIYRDIITDNINIGLLIPSYNLVNNNCILLGQVSKVLETNMPIFPPHGAVTLIHRETFLALGGYFLNFDRQDGYMLWLRFYNSEKKIKILDDVIFSYRQHNRSLSNDRKEILTKRYSILEELVSLNVIRFNLVLYGLPGEDMESLIDKVSYLLDFSQNSYLYYSHNINISKLSFIKRETFGKFQSFEFLNDYNLESSDFNIFINPKFSGNLKSILHCLFTAKITNERKNYFLAERINTEIYLGYNKLKNISFGRDLHNENPIFAKIPGLEVHPRNVENNSESFIIEYKF